MYLKVYYTIYKVYHITHIYCCIQCTLTQHKLYEVYNVAKML